MLWILLSKTQKLLLALCEPQSRGDLTTTNDILLKEKPCFAFISEPTLLFWPGPDQPWSLSRSPKVPHSPLERDRGCQQVGTASSPPRGSKREQKHRSHVVSQNTGN